MQSERRETYLYFRELGIEFVFKTNNKLISIDFSYPFSGKTDKGIKIGDTMEDVIKAYGEPTNHSQGEISYSKDSTTELFFELDESDHVKEISIE
jgi:hypothetical protein